jgi:hypothetical protein
VARLCALERLTRSRLVRRARFAGKFFSSKQAADVDRPTKRRLHVANDHFRYHREVHVYHNSAMGSFISLLFGSSKPVRALMLGLDAAGKTTLTYKLKLGEVISTIPTM